MLIHFGITCADMIMNLSFLSLSLSISRSFFPFFHSLSLSLSLSLPLCMFYSLVFFLVLPY